MSYSFSIKASTKNEACTLVAAEWDKVVAGQPTHAADRQAAQDVAKAIIGVLREPAADESICVSMNGSLSWRGEAPNLFNAASVNVSANVSKS